MKTCDGCGYAFTSTAEIFGGIGQGEFCLSCWYEEVELAKLREPLEREKRELTKNMSETEKEMDAICAPGYFEEEYGGMTFASVSMNLEHERAAVWFRLSDVQDELDCLTVAYQRKHSVIGRAAA